MFKDNMTLSTIKRSTEIESFGTMVTISIMITSIRVITADLYTHPYYN